jgi:glycosyltransferase involved in cell wall biosynthesis
MRIALYHNLPSGGAKRHTYEQVRELARRGHEIVEFAPSTADVEFCSFEPFINGRHIFPLSPVAQLQQRIPLVTPYIHAAQGITTLRRTEQVNKQMAAAIDAGGFDFVFAKDCHIIMNPYVLRYLQTPTLFQCHHGLRHRLEYQSDQAHADDVSLRNRLKASYYAPAHQTYRRKFEADEYNNIRHAKRIITNSKFSQQLLQDAYQVQSTVVYPGINTDLFVPLDSQKQDYVLCVGAVIYSKGYRFLISALGEVSKRRRPKLFIAANSRDPVEERVIRKLAAEKEVDLHIERITSDSRLVQVYNEALAFVYAPLQEALGMAPLEAMACGLPVVAVGEGGIKETVRDGQTGWVVARNEKLFAEVLVRLLSNLNERDRKAVTGIEYVRTNWSWQVAIDGLEQQFSHLLAGKLLEPVI